MLVSDSKSLARPRAVPLSLEGEGAAVVTWKHAIAYPRIHCSAALFVEHMRVSAGNSAIVQLRHDAVKSLVNAKALKQRAAAIVQHFAGKTEHHSSWEDSLGLNRPPGSKRTPSCRSLSVSEDTPGASRGPHRAEVQRSVLCLDAEVPKTKASSAALTLMRRFADIVVGSLQPFTDDFADLPNTEDITSELAYN